MMYRFVKTYIICLVMMLSLLQSAAQSRSFDIITFKLPPALAYFNNQFSSLNIYKKQLLLMAESRLLEPDQQAEIFCVKLNDLEKQMTDSNYVLPYKTIPIVGLDTILHRLYRNGFVVEGLEAMVIHHKDVYFSVETTPETPYDYLLKGSWEKLRIVLDVNKVIPIWKPRFPNGEAVYNASFECMEWYRNRLFIFHEFNYFKDNNYVYSFGKNLDPADKDSFPMNRMPYRISDLKSLGNDHFIAINSFYKGGGRDTVNRPEITDTSNYNRVFRKNAFEDFVRLVDIYFDGTKFSWQPVYEFPAKFTGFNWEGIATYKNGYFIVNDKYTPAKPYYTSLIYLQPTDAMKKPAR